MRVANSSVAAQKPVLQQALAAVESDMPGTRARDLSWDAADYTLEFDLVTEYDPSLCPSSLSPVARTTGRWNAFLSSGDAAGEVHKATVEHRALLADVHAGLYRA